jgi:hypothetical protein
MKGTVPRMTRYFPKGNIAIVRVVCLSIEDLKHSLQRHNTENSKHIYPAKEMLGLSPNFHILVSVSDLYTYSYDRSVYSVAGKYVDRSWEYKSLTDT